MQRNNYNNFSTFGELDVTNPFFVAFNGNPINASVKEYFENYYLEDIRKHFNGLNEKSLKHIFSQIQLSNKCETFIKFLTYLFISRFPQNNQYSPSIKFFFKNFLNNNEWKEKVLSIFENDTCLTSLTIRNQDIVFNIKLNDIKLIFNILKNESNTNYEHEQNIDKKNTISYLLNN